MSLLSARKAGSLRFMDSRYTAETAADNAALEKILCAGLQRSFSAPAPDQRRSGALQILDLACGSCREMDVVTRALQTALPATAPTIRFVGADIRGAQIDAAQERSLGLGSPLRQYEFVREDCTRLNQHKLLGSGFDLVFVRHQNFWNDRRAWDRIFCAGLERLKEDGLFVITSYFDVEHQMALQAIAKAGGKLVTNVRNSWSRELSTSGKSVDRHLAVFRGGSVEAVWCPQSGRPGLIIANRGRDSFAEFSVPSSEKP